MVYVRWKMAMLAIQGVLLVAVFSWLAQHGASIVEWGSAHTIVVALVAGVGLAIGLPNELHARLRRRHTHVLTPDVAAVFLPMMVGILALVVARDSAGRAQGVAVAALFAVGYLAAVALAGPLAHPIRKRARSGAPE